MKRKSITNLQIIKQTHPEIAAEWDYERNAPLKPTDVTAGSNLKVHWKCSNGHSWSTIINNRTGKNSQCPYCRGKACEDNNLAVTHPEIAVEWDYEENGELSLENVTHGSSKVVGWKCPEGHKWRTAICNRTGRKSNCPYCSGKVATPENNLLVLYPEVAAEWDYKKNGKLRPENFLPKSHQKVYWVCSNGHPSYRASISDRTGGTNCPKCFNQSSRLEIALFAEMSYLFENVEGRAKIGGKECDIYLPDLDYGIEVDGYYWHKDKDIDDSKKNDYFRKHNVSLLRVRDNRLDKIEEWDILHSKGENPLSIIKKVVSQIRDFVPLTEKERKDMEQYLKENKIKNGKLCQKMCVTKLVLGTSLADKEPELATEWDYERNYPLTPKMVKPNSHRKVYWLCPKNHNWETKIYNRTRGTKCPECWDERRKSHDS
jgi:hypothetical protein